MKIALPSRMNQIDEHFGHCPDFDGLDLKTQGYKVVKKYWGTTFRIC